MTSILIVAFDKEISNRLKTVTRVIRHQQNGKGKTSRRDLKLEMTLILVKYKWLNFLQITKPKEHCHIFFRAGRVIIYFQNLGVNFVVANGAEIHLYFREGSEGIANVNHEEVDTSLILSHYITHRWAISSCLQFDTCICSSIEALANHCLYIWIIKKVQSTLPRFKIDFPLLRLLAC